MIAGTTVQISILRRLSFAVLALLACSTPLSAQTLAWNANTEANLAGYRVQYGTTSTSFSTTVDVGRVTTWRISGPTPGVRYYYRVVAYNTSGLTSTPSSPISYTLPTSPTTPASPTLTSVSPSSGPTSGGTAITLTGTGFVSGARVSIGGAAASGVTFVSSTQLRATTPPGSAGAREVRVTNPDGRYGTRASGFTYTTTSPSPAGLTVSGVSPSSGPTGGGTVITVTGSGFVSGARVSIGTLVAGNVVFVSSTQLRATTPYSSTTGARDVRVTNPDGRYAIRAGGFTYGTTTSPSPSPSPSPSGLTVSGVSPSSGPTGGGTVITVTGSGFVSGARVSIGTLVAGNVAFVSSTQLRATTPYSSTTGSRDVRVTNPNGQYAVRAGGFTYTTGTTTTPPPSSSLTVSGVSPSSGPRSGGTTITVTGSGFVSGARVSIGTLVASNVVFVSSTQLRARTPYSSTSGARDVRVTNPNGQYAVRSGGFSYVNTTSSSSELTASATTFSSFLAEGVQTDQMRTQLAIANAEESDAQVNVTFMDAAGQATEMAVDVPARSRQTVDLSTVPQLAGQTFSTRVDSTQPVAVDRLVSLDAEGRSASLESAVSQASASWYFAEGSTIDPMELFYLVQNPGTTPAGVQVRYLRPDGQAAVTKTYQVAAGSRATIWVDREDPALASSEVAAEITSLDGTPIVVERSLYLKEPGAAQPRGGDTSAGVTAPATRWFLEASTGAGQSRLLLANPGSEAAEVRATYTREDGRRVARSYAVAAGSRQTIDVAAQDPSLADARLAVAIESTAPIVAERSTWWGTRETLDDAVSGGGVTEGAARWLLAEAEQGGARQAATEVVIFNLGAATTVKVTLLFEGAPEVSATFPVAAGARFTVPMADAFPGADGRRFSVLVEGADPAASFVVDRAIYWQGGGRTAGADGAAQRLR